MAADTAKSAAGAARWRRFARPGQEQIVLLVTLMLAAVFAFTLPGFASIGNLLVMARSVAILGILGIAMGVVVIGRGLDLSLVASMAVSTAVALQLLQAGWPPAAALGVALALSLIAGLVNGYVIAFIEVPALFATLATGFLIYGLGRALLLGGVIVYLPHSAHALEWLGQGRLLGVPMPVIAFVVTAVIVHLLLSRTTLGRFIYAHGDNAETARLTGIAVRPLTLLEYALAAVVSLVAGLVLAGSTASMDTQVVNSTMIFDVILVVVLGGASLAGGRGSVISVVVGTALIGTLLNGMTIMNLDNNVQNIVKGVVLLAAIALDNRLHPRDEETARQGDL